MIKIKDLSHIYPSKNEEALKKVNLHVKKGENIVLIGSSGSGKSTLLRSINKLIEPTSGEIIIDGEDILNTSKRKTIKIRGKIAMVFQEFNLVNRKSVLQNILNGRLRYNNLLNTLMGRFSEKDYLIVNKNIERVGLKGYEEELVDNLSGGQKQRVAIARALSQEPDIILADEPVSSLDPRLMREIMELLMEVCSEKEITLVTSLHFLELAKKYGSRIIGLKNGEIIFEGKPEELIEKEIINIYGDTGF